MPLCNDCRSLTKPHCDRCGNIMNDNLEAIPFGRIPGTSELDKSSDYVKGIIIGAGTTIIFVLIIILISVL